MSKILIAEDNHQTSQAIGNLLQEQGYETIAAFDGIEALEVLVKEPLDLMILDLKMPRMRGEEVLQKLRRVVLPKDVEIVVYSSQMTGETVGQKHAVKMMRINSHDLCGVTGRPVLKPIEITFDENVSLQLVRVVNEILGKRAGDMAEAKKSILVVEDNTGSLNSVVGRLKKENFHVFRAADGEKALEELQKQKEKIKLVVLDLNLPKIPGTEILKFIREDKDLKLLPVIIITAEKSEPKFLPDNRTSFYTGEVDGLVKEIKRWI